MRTVVIPLFLLVTVLLPPVVRSFVTPVHELIQSRAAAAAAASSLTWSTTGSPKDDETGDVRGPPSGGIVGAENITSLSTRTVQQALAMKSEAQRLRDEAAALQIQVAEEKERRLARERADIDRWTNELLVAIEVGEDMQVLNTVDRVKTLIQDGRYSPEHVVKIFGRLSEILGPQSRSRLSPITELLVEAAGELDAIEREKNPNKRWRGRVEQKLRKKLFAMDWGIDLDELEDEE